MIDINLIISNTFYIILLLSAVPLLTSLIIGLLVSVFQASTQIQDASLAFIPKVIFVFMSIMILLPWSIDTLSSFTIELFSLISSYGQAK